LKQPTKSRRSANDYAKGVVAGDRVILGQAITLIESNLIVDQKISSELIDKLINKTGQSIRIGITGVPGVGKSTFIEALGKQIIDAGKKVAVLTIDPSSQLTRGSILGDKTRMEDLSKNAQAFIRPTASGNMLGGVAGKTRETILLCEAAGYDVIIIETVGVGQSEVAVKNMCDFFLLLMLAGAGDELQGIKKGIMEMADAIVITKADGENIKQATRAQSEFQHALHILTLPLSGWHPEVLISSAQTHSGIDTVWNMILKFKDRMESTGFLKTNRNQQNIAWFQESFDALLRSDARQILHSNAAWKTLEQHVNDKKLSPPLAAQHLLLAYHQAIRESKS